MCLKDEDTSLTCANYVMISPLTLKVTKLAAKVDKLLEKCTFDNEIVRCIDRYYYIQKSVELKMIYEALIETRLPQQVITPIYAEVFDRWRKDSRWLNHHILFKKPCQQTFTSFYVS